MFSWRRCAWLFTGTTLFLALPVSSAAEGEKAYQPATEKKPAAVDSQGDSLPPGAVARLAGGLLRS